LEHSGAKQILSHGIMMGGLEG